MFEIHFAPLQGYTDHIYRRAHARIFGGIDCYYTPFIRIEKGAPRRQDMARLNEALTDGTPLVPQIIFNSVDEFNVLTSAIKALGINRIDLNLGCPYPMQTHRGRGAAMITNIEVMTAVCDIIASDDASYSVKMRLGTDSPEQWQTLINLLNNTHLDHITMYPCIAKQMYDGEIDIDQMHRFIEASENPVIYNGGILSAADIDRIAHDMPQIKGVMIGRGLLARPSLAAEWREGSTLAPEQFLDKVLEMHDALLTAYESTLCGQTQILLKIKPFWDYLEPTIGHKTCKAIRKANTVDRYRSVITSI